METDETKRGIRKTKEKIFKKLKDLIMMEEIFNQHINKIKKDKKIWNSIKSPGEAVGVVNNMKNIIRSKKLTYYGLRYNKAKSLKNSKRMKIL